MNRIKLTTVTRGALMALAMLLFEAPMAVAEPDLPPVVLVAPLEAGVNLHPPLVGEVVAETTATVGFQAAGRISERLVRRGERVEGDQLLARLDERDLAARVDSAQAELKQARADARLAEQELERSRQLFERKVGSRQALDQAISRQEASASRVTSAAARLTEAENALGYVVLTAPFSGVVTGLFADVGDVMAIGQPVVRLAADDGRLVEVAVPERRRGDLAAQVQAQVQARLEADGVTVEAELDTISGAADPVSRSYAARYRLPPRAADEVPWSLGQTATLLFVTGDMSQGSGQQRVPVGAIFARNGQSQLFRVTDDRLEAIPVVVRAIEAGYADIESSLPIGTLVVIAGVNRLHDGQPVRPCRGGEVATGTGEESP